MTTTSGDPELERKFSEAMAARDRNDVTLANRLLTEIVSDPRADSSVLGASHSQLGYISQQLLNDARTAVGHFARAVAAAPRHELCSLGLFHALDEIDAEVDALDEALRYLSLRDSKEYRTFLVDGYADGLSPRAQERFAQVRALLAKRDSPDVQPG